MCCSQVEAARRSILALAKSRGTIDKLVEELVEISLLV